MIYNDRKPKKTGRQRNGERFEHEQLVPPRTDRIPLTIIGKRSENASLEPYAQDRLRIPHFIT